MHILFGFYVNIDYKSAKFLNMLWFLYLDKIKLNITWGFCDAKLAVKCSLGKEN